PARGADLDDRQPLHAEEQEEEPAPQVGATPAERLVHPVRGAGTDLRAGRDQIAARVLVGEGGLDEGRRHLALPLGEPLLHPGRSLAEDAKDDEIPPRRKSPLPPPRRFWCRLPSMQTSTFRALAILSLLSVAAVA